MADTNPITAPSLLTDNHLNQLNHALTMVGHARRHVEQAKMAGLPTEELTATLDNVEAQARKIKNVYFPGR